MKKPKRLFDFLEYQLNNPLEKSINTKYDGKWVSLSTHDFFEKVQIVSRKLIEIVDVLGRKSRKLKNQPLFYIYDDGSVEKRIILE